MDSSCSIIKIVIVILLVTMTMLPMLCYASDENVKYIVVKMNSTGQYITVPSVSTFINFTYKGYMFYAFWDGKCVYFRATEKGIPITLHIDMYGVPATNMTAQYIASIDATDKSQYCNASLPNYIYLILNVRFPDGEVVGPIGIFRSGLLSITLPEYLIPYLPFILIGLAVLFCAFYNLRYVLAGLIAFVGFSFFIINMLANYLPPWLKITYFTLLLFIAIGLGYALIKRPEQ